MRRSVRGILLAVTGIVVISGMAPAQQSSCDTGRLRREIEELNRLMVECATSTKEDVTQFYAEDASIVHGGGRVQGREQIRRYWSEGPAWKDWKLDVQEIGGGCDAPWLRGRSTLTSESGRSMVTDFVAILKRDREGQLRYYIDMYVAARS